MPASTTGPTIRSLGSGTTDEEIVGFDITVYEIFLVDGLHSGDLRDDIKTSLLFWGGVCRTICLAAMQTVLVENLRPHMSKRSSKLGPRRSMTKMLCRPSCPK